MEYKVGEVFYSQELAASVRCVADNGNSSCERCVFNDGGGACPAKGYDRHPCYHSDRSDGTDVHFETTN